MNNKILQFTYLLVLPIFLSACSTEQTFYISPDGNDQNIGTKNHPFATLERAKTAIRENKDKSITIFLREGYYPLQQSFTLKEDDISENSSVLISALPGEDVHLIGGKKISGFKPLDKDSEANRIIPIKMRKNILQINLKKQGIEDYGEITARGFGRAIQPSGLELYFNGKPMTLSRWPNEGWTNIKDVTVKLDGKGFVYKGSRPEKWLDAKDVWLHGYWKYDWSDSYVKIAEIDTAKKVVLTEAPYSNYPFTAGKRYYAFNALEELDAPGEWYLERKTGILYFWPPSDPEKASIYVAILREPLIQLKNTNHLTFKNISFEYTCGAGIEIIGGSDNLIDNCILRNIGTVAISIGRLVGNLGGMIYENTLYNGDAGTENGVKDCKIYATGEGGIILGGGDRKTLTPGKNFAVNNDIFDCSRWVRTYRAGVFMYGVGNIIAHNHIHDLPHTAVFFWGNNHLLEYNEIDHVCMETGDAGAFYLGRDWTQRGSLIRYNYFHHLHGVEGQSGFTDVMAIYLDDWASGTTIFGNIFFKAGRSIMIGGGRDNLVENNIVIDGNPAMHVDARGLGWASYYFDGTNNTLFERLQVVNPTASPYKDRYPQLAELLNDDPLLPKGNRIIRNISSGGRWIDLLNGVNDSLVYFQDNITNADPSFYTIDGDKLHLKQDSSFYPIGFHQIPTDKIGLKK